MDSRRVDQVSINTPEYICNDATPQFVDIFSNLKEPNDGERANTSREQVTPNPKVCRATRIGSFLGSTSVTGASVSDTVTVRRRGGSVAQLQFKGDLAETMVQSCSATTKSDNVSWISSDTGTGTGTERGLLPMNRSISCQTTSSSKTMSSPTLYGTKVAATIKCPEDHIVMCRLIGLHSLGSSLKDVVKIQSKYSFRHIKSIKLAGNLKCSIFEEPISAYKRRILDDCALNRKLMSSNFIESIEDLDDSKCHLIFSLNWFSPQTVWDYVSLGFQVIMRSTLESKYGMLGRLYFDKAEDFAWSPEVQSVLRTYELSFPDNGGSDAGLITFTGFSLGGSIAHALAFVFREVLNLRMQRMRVLGFGCPRPGSELFSDWFRRELQLDSCNIILYDEQIAAKNATFSDEPNMDTDETSSRQTKRGSICQEYDPAPLRPPLKNGFDFHPNCFILHKRFGTLRPLGLLEKHHIEQLAEQVTSSISFLNQLPGVSAERDRLWTKLHGIYKYYEAMHGLGDD